MVATVALKTWSSHTDAPVYIYIYIYTYGISSLKLNYTFLNHRGIW